ncbi:hypothetical protein R3P38DRAFT_2797079 [Favolaschia claudopus]|uniref:Uncharacterized protein n=1 Tax=Favolaschia claudopus TaxID=2862362 RepID=A0AAW0A4M0_9AGAR
MQGIIDLSTYAPTPSTSAFSLPKPPPTKPAIFGSHGSNTSHTSKLPVSHFNVPLPWREQTNYPGQNVLSPVGLQWDDTNWSCGYDSVFTLFHRLWASDPFKWTAHLTNMHPLLHEWVLGTRKFATGAQRWL